MAAFHNMYFSMVLFFIQFVYSIHQTYSSEQNKGSLQDYSRLHSNASSCESCPPWSVCRESKCKCLKLKNLYLKCDKHHTSLQSCACISSGPQFNVGRCLYSCHSNETLTVFQNSNSFEKNICKKFNRSGDWCATCIEGTCPLALSYRLDCVDCPNARQNWVNVILLAVGPTSVFFAAIIMFRIDITKPHVYAFVTYSQILSAPVFLQRSLVMFSSTFHKKLSDTYFAFTSCFYGIWSLDFCREFYHNTYLDLSMVQIQMLEYMVLIFPLYLILLIYIFKKVFEYIFFSCSMTQKSYISCWNCKKDRRKATYDLVDQYAAFFVLSSTKLLSASINLLLPVRATSLKDNSVRTVLYIDGNQLYFRGDHFVPGIMAVVVTIVLFVLPTLTILLHLFKCGRIKTSSGIVSMVHLFARRFYKHYKDGSAESTNYRYFATFHIALVTTMQLLYGIVSSPVMFLLGGGVLFLAASLFAVLKPYKNDNHSKIFFGLHVTLGLQHLLLFEVDNGTLTPAEVISMWCFLFLFSSFPFLYCCVAIIYLYCNPMKYWKQVSGMAHPMNPFSNSDSKSYHE